MTDRFGQAMGIWHVSVGGADLDLKPKLGDNRKFRNILLDEEIKKNKPKLFDAFEQLMYELIKRDYPEEEDNKIKEYIEYNVNELFEETLVRFRWTTKEDLDKAKSEADKEIKKLIGGN